jgi:hypothetical protein
MQTFLPYKSFLKSALCLDNKRLGKQRVEVYQIYNTITNKSKGWKNHPAVKMWKNYEHALLLYGIYICLIWKSKGFNDSLLPFFLKHINTQKIKTPHWLNNYFIRAHRSNLLRKNFKHYKQFNWIVPKNLNYIWPI